MRIDLSAATPSRVLSQADIRDLSNISDPGQVDTLIVRVIALTGGATVTVAGFMTDAGETEDDADGLAYEPMGPASTTPVLDGGTALDTAHRSFRVPCDEHDVVFALVGGTGTATLAVHGTRG